MWVLHTPVPPGPRPRTHAAAAAAAGASPAGMCAYGGGGAGAAALSLSLSRAQLPRGAWGAPPPPRGATLLRSPPLPLPSRPRPPLHAPTTVSVTVLELDLPGVSLRSASEPAPWAAACIAAPAPPCCRQLGARRSPGPAQRTYGRAARRCCWRLVERLAGALGGGALGGNAACLAATNTGRERERVCSGRGVARGATASAACDWHLVCGLRARLCHPHE